MRSVNGNHPLETAGPEPADLTIGIDDGAGRAGPPSRVQLAVGATLVLAVLMLFGRLTPRDSDPTRLSPVEAAQASVEAFNSGEFASWAAFLSLNARIDGVDRADPRFRQLYEARHAVGEQLSILSDEFGECAETFDRNVVCDLATHNEFHGAAGLVPAFRATFIFDRHGYIRYVDQLHDLEREAAFNTGFRDWLQAADPSRHSGISWDPETDLPLAGSPETLAAAVTAFVDGHPAQPGLSIGETMQRFLQRIPAGDLGDLAPMFSPEVTLTLGGSQVDMSVNELTALHEAFAAAGARITVTEPCRVDVASSSIGCRLEWTDELHPESYRLPVGVFASYTPRTGRIERLTYAEGDPMGAPGAVFRDAFRRWANREHPGAVTWFDGIDYPRPASVPAALELAALYAAPVPHAA